MGNITALNPNTDKIEKVNVGDSIWIDGKCGVVILIDESSDRIVLLDDRGNELEVLLYYSRSR